MKEQKTEQIYERISDIIKSCTDDLHFKAIDILIELFERERNTELTDELKYKRAIKWNEIHSIIDPNPHNP